MCKSISAILLILIFFSISFSYYEAWKKGTILNGGDAFGYYAYLPALFIHHDIDNLQKSLYYRNTEAGQLADSTQTLQIEEAHAYKDKQVIKYTCGIALLETPAFFIAHWLAPWLGYRPNGYSVIYRFFVLFNNILFSLLGLLILRKVLLQYFNEVVAAITLLLIGIGTNLYFFSSYNTGMSHGYLFTLYAALLYFSVRYFDNSSIANGLATGLCCGLITLIRPNEMYCVLVPILYGSLSAKQLLGRLIMLLKKPSAYFAIAAFALCAIPQMLYWYKLTGSSFYYSYTTESFDFRHPKIIDGLFGYKNGWFPYTPVMLLAVLGIFMLKGNLKKWKLLIGMILPIHIYIIYSWWCWFYMGGLGSRPMIEMYALLAIPLAATIQSFWRTLLFKTITGLVTTVLIAHQLSLTYQRYANIMWSEDSNATHYWQTLFKHKADINDIIVYDTNERQPTQTNSKALLAQVACNEQGVCDTAVAVLNQKQYLSGWIRATCKVCNTTAAFDMYHYAALVIEIKHDGQVIKRKQIRLLNKLSSDGTYGIWRADFNTCGEVGFCTKIPKNYATGDTVMAYINYSADDIKLNISTLKLEIMMK